MLTLGFRVELCKIIQENMTKSAYKSIYFTQLQGKLHDLMLKLPLIVKICVRKVLVEIWFQGRIGRFSESEQVGVYERKQGRNTS